MRFRVVLLVSAFGLFALAGGLLAQQSAPSPPSQQQALRDARAKAAAAERRSELLRQEASNASGEADRILAQRAALSAEIDSASAQIAMANARMAIIALRQRQQRAQLGQESAPVLRLNSALQQMTARPAVLMMAQPGQRTDYIHLRAVMATVQPEIARRTVALRRQIAVQTELRAQELDALKTLDRARARLSSRQTALAKLEGDARGKAGDLSAVAAFEFEQAIAQGERARDIVESIDTLRLSRDRGAALARLDGPLPRAGGIAPRSVAGRNAFRIPSQSTVVSGFGELNATGYRERGVRLALPAGAAVGAPAAGRISYAGRYRSFGQIVIIEHGNGWVTLVTNLASLDVAKGSRVAQGASLGKTSGQRAEITLELRRNGRVMDIAAMVS